MKFFSVLCFLCMAITFLEASQIRKLAGHNVTSHNATEPEEHHEGDEHDHDEHAHDKELLLEGKLNYRLKSEM